MNLFYLSIILLLLPHCASIKKKKIFEPIQQQSDQRIGVKPEWRFKKDVLHVDKMIEDGISQEQAIAIGIDNNPALQAKFEEIGISKADLIQAGFFTNPYVQTIFRIPTQCDSQTNIEFTASFALSDLWQVPFRKKIAQDELEIKTYEILDEILILRSQIQKGYVDILYHQELLKITKEITHVIESLRDRIYYRYQFGYTNDLDKYVADSRLGEWQAKVIEHQALLAQSYITFHQLLGGQVTNEPIKFIDTLSLPSITMSSEKLEQYAMNTHPQILIERSKINRAEHSISYEESRIIDNVQFGVSYERDLEKNQSGAGPLFGINIPLFNTNYGNIERAKFEVKQAEKTLIARQRLIHEHLIKQLTQYEAYLKQITHYQKNVIPPTLKAIEYSITFFDRMQMDMILFLETQINLYNYKINVVNLTYQAAIEYSNLELTLGAQLNHIKI